MPADHDVVYLGYPNWWGTMPMAVCTFLEEYDFTGKMILPFCTHEGTAWGAARAIVRKLCANARVLEGLPIRGGSVRGAADEIEVWLRRSAAVA